MNTWLKLAAFCMIGLGILPQCTDLASFELYPELTSGEWRLASRTIAGVVDTAACNDDDVARFFENGDYQYDFGLCAPLGFARISTGTWTFKDKGETLYVRERRTNSISYHRFEAVVRADSLFLSEEFEDGVDTYLYIRQ